MSLDKIRCSAFPLLGSIFSKDSSIIHLLANSMNSSRSVVQKPVTVVVIPTIQFLCVAMSVLVYLIRKLNGGVSFEKVDHFIAEINQLRSKQHSVQKAVKTRISQTIEQQISSSNEEKQLDTRRELILGKTSLLSPAAQQTPNHNKILLKIASFTGIALVYIQFCFLVYLTSQTQLRMGFMFLLACIFYLSYINLKISLTAKLAAKLREPKRRISRRETMTNSDMNSINSPRPTISVLANTPSRSQVTTENLAEKEKLL